MTHANEKHERNKVLAVFAALSALSLFLFNYFSASLEQGTVVSVNVWWVIPFVLLLAAIASGPFMNRRWWDNNYAYVSYGLGLVVIVYYVGLLGVPGRLFRTLYEYVSFISLIGSLFIVAGGIHIHIRGKAAPWENIMFLGTGAVLSNILGTTGASMILIRPYLRTNKYRIRGYHIAFFIFLIANIGGALTPVGDPPLFLGFLKGVPFFWVFSRVNEIWAFTVLLLLVVFFLIDMYFYRKESLTVQHAAAHPDEPQVSGLHNIFFLFIILGAVFIERPLMVREIVMWGAALGSFYTTGKHIHDKNEFTFHPIKEVTILFAGIFATMIPALDWLDLHGASLGLVTPGQYFWGSGILSSVLDNAPTYLNFLTASFGLHGANVDNPHHMQMMLGMTTPSALGLANPLQPGVLAFTSETWRYVQAVSVGAVFFGAMTYIGNGPNFMVKSIVEHAGVECPTFFGYIIRYSIPVLLPVFLLVWFIFFRI
jgi:Na+/H+ antiporter NhaD/arsenite permease-like protein